MREYDESDVRVRSGKGSRPRTKNRPTHADAREAMVVTVDRGRWGCALDGNPDDRELLRRFGLFGPPAILFFDAAGREQSERRVIGFQKADDFLASLEAAGIR